MIEKIKKYRNEILVRQILGIVGSTIILLFCVTAFFFITAVVAGWLEEWKVENILSQAVMISLMVILIAVVIWVGYQMVMTSRRYHTAILRLDLLILKLELSHEENLAPEWVERELQMIMRVLESFSVER